MIASLRVPESRAWASSASGLFRCCIRRRFADEGAPPLSCVGSASELLILYEQIRPGKNRVRNVEAAA
ncbi:hypothetical protein NL676_024617 [Syzygium grande]|nr:hypothetical protein NL676_024617 [Syzygium grande]